MQLGGVPLLVTADGFTMTETHCRMLRKQPWPEPNEETADGRRDRGGEGSLPWGQSSLPWGRREEQTEMRALFSRIEAVATKKATALFFFSHSWSTSNPNQQSFRPNETTDNLAPRFSLALDEHSIASRFKLRRRRFHTINIKLKPGLRDLSELRPNRC